jgi:hypothetical protein
VRAFQKGGQGVDTEQPWGLRGDTDSIPSKEVVMNDQTSCVMCEYNHTQVPDMILARWRDMDICTDCLEHRPGKEDAEAEARGEQSPISQQAYRDDGGGCCPTCQATGYTVVKVTGEDSSLYQHCRGDHCAHRWTMVYRLGGYIREGGVHEDEDLDAIQDVIAVDTAKETSCPRPK